MNNSLKTKRNSYLKYIISLILYEFKKKVFTRKSDNVNVVEEADRRELET